MRDLVQERRAEHSMERRRPAAIRTGDVLVAQAPFRAALIRVASGARDAAFEERRDSVPVAREKAGQFAERNRICCNEPTRLFSIAALLRES